MKRLKNRSQDDIQHQKKVNDVKKILGLIPKQFNFANIKIVTGSSLSKILPFYGEMKSPLQQYLIDKIFVDRPDTSTDSNRVSSIGISGRVRFVGLCGFTRDDERPTTLGFFIKESQPQL